MKGKEEDLTTAALAAAARGNGEPTAPASESETEKTMRTHEEGSTTTSTSDDAVAPSLDEAPEPLLDAHDAESFKRKWDEIQVAFVDEPRAAVERADALVADVMQRLAAGFSDVRGSMEAHWNRGDDVSTEDLRVALTHYRSFFDRLLSA
jgi:hypothetical protein